MSDEPEFADDNDAILNRADTLLNRHRTALTAGQAIPVLNDTLSAPAGDATAIPTLTDIVEAPAALQASTAGRVVSEVQMKNLEQAVYQKVQHRLDQEIATALHTFRDTVKANIDSLVRASIAEALREQQAATAPTAPGIMRDPNSIEPKK